MKWIKHNDVLYNLEKFVQIQGGDECEILLSTEVHNMDWEDETKHCVLKYYCKEKRDQAFINLWQFLVE